MKITDINLGALKSYEWTTLRRFIKNAMTFWKLTLDAIDNQEKKQAESDATKAFGELYRLGLTETGIADLESFLRFDIEDTAETVLLDSNDLWEIWIRSLVTRH